MPRRKKNKTVSVISPTIKIEVPPKGPLVKDRELLEQQMQDINRYIQFHADDPQKALIRAKLRHIHQNLNTCDDKKKVRGMLIYLGRWDMIKIWLRITKILENIRSTNQISEDLKHQIINNNRFVSSKDILKNWEKIFTIRANPDTCGMRELTN